MHTNSQISAGRSLFLLGEKTTELRRKALKI